RPPEQLGALYFIIGATDDIYGVMKPNREAQPGARRLVDRHRGGLPEALLDMSQRVIVSAPLFVAPDQVGAALGRVPATQGARSRHRPHPLPRSPPGSATTTRNGPWFVQPHQVPAYAVAVDQCLRQAGAQPFEQLRGEPIVVEHQPVIATIGRRISVLGAIH